MHVNNNTVEMKIDTGAKCNVLSKMTFTQVKNDEQIWPCFKSTNLVSYSGSKIKPVGIVRLCCHLEGEVYTLSFYIVEEHVLPLLGLRAHMQTGLVSFSEAVHHLSPTDDDLSDEIQKECSDLFSDGLGKLPVTYSTTHDPDVKPAVRPAHHIPVAMKDRVMLSVF